MVVALTLLTWVRNIAKFSFIFMFANLCIITGATITTCYALAKIYEDGIHSDVSLIKPNGVFTMLGFSIYVYEGIGVLMPIMQACDCPEKFDSILVRAVITLTFFYIGFSLVCNLAWGTMGDKQIIT